MQELRTTTSFCPTCCEEIPATVYEKDDGIYMKKSCPAGHGPFDVLIERDKDYYKHWMQNDFSKPRPYVSICIPITHACNMKCYFCYAPNRKTDDDIAPEKVKELVRTFPGYHVLFSGGEPTLCPYLPDYLKVANEVKKFHSIATNGIKMADKEYMKVLTDAGLGEVTVTLYGFNDEAYGKMAGRPMMKIRKANLENLRKAGVPVTLSFTVNRGVNEKDIPYLFELAMKNADMAYQIRMRSVTPSGSGGNDQPLFVSEHIKVFAEIFDVSVEELKEYNYSRGPYMEATFDPMFKVPKNPQHFELNLIHFLKEQAAKGNKRCQKFLKMRPKRNENHPDSRMRPDFLILTAWNWTTLQTADLTFLRNIPLAYYTYNAGIMGFPIAVLVSGRLAVL